MNPHETGARATLVVAAILATCNALAQQAPVKRDFDAEVQAALQSAKTEAGFEFLGTLVRTCLLPQSGGEDASDNVPGYVANPASAPARDTWYAEPAKVFDNLYFVGGKIHSSWALTTSEGIILIDQAISNICSSLTLTPTISGAPKCCRPGTASGSSWAGPIGTWSRSTRTGTRPWRRGATSSRPTA